MAKSKFDGVVEAVRYDPDGQVDWVRVYLRHGPIFADRILVNRKELIDTLKTGKKLLSGKRLLYKANTFEVYEPLKVIRVNGQDAIVIGDQQSGKDNLQGVPIV